MTDLRNHVGPLYREYVGKACPYCGRSMSVMMHRPTREHILPKSRGGVDSPSNVIIVCAKCNSDKSNMTIGEFLGWLLHHNDYRVATMQVLVDAAINSSADLAEQIASDIEAGIRRAEGVAAWVILKRSHLRTIQ